MVPDGSGTRRGAYLRTPRASGAHFRYTFGLRGAPLPLRPVTTPL
jgi:hypothetical protein